MDVSKPWVGHRTRSGAVGLTVLAAHAGLVILGLRAALLASPPPVNPLVVNLLEPTARRPEIHDIFHPELAHVMPLIVPRPELEIPRDTAEAAVAAEVAPANQAAPPLSAAAPTALEVLPTMSNVAYLEQPAPRYPPQSRRAREEGLVILRVTIDARGRVLSVDVQRSSGHPRLDEAARSAVARALFRPYVFDGVARAASATIPIEFSLRAESS